MPAIQSKTYLAPGDDPALFNFDTDSIDYNSTNPTLNSRIPVGAVLYANFNGKQNAVTGQIANLNGAPGHVASKEILCSGSDGVYYNITNQSAGAIRVRYKPTYTGTPGENRNIIAIQEPSGANNRIVLTHSPSGDNFRVTLTNSTGTNVYLATVIGASAINLQNQYYEIELNWDAAAGVVRLFLDGTLHGTLTPGAWTHVSNSARIYIGAAPTIYDSANATFDDLMLFSSVQHTTSYAPVLFFEYDLNNPSLSVATAETEISKIISLVVSSSVVANTNLKFVVIVNGQAKYWDGYAWVDSSGVNESTNYNDTTIEWGELITESSTVSWVWYFVSDGETAPILNSWTYEFESLEFADVFGNFIHPDGTVPAEGRVLAQIENFTEIDGTEFLQLDNLYFSEATFNSTTGSWSISVLTDANYRFIFLDSNKNVYEVVKSVTGVGDVNFNNLITVSAS